MSFLVVFFIFIALTGLYSIIGNTRNPPMLIESAELPTDVRQFILKFFPNFAASEIKRIPMQREYKIIGLNEGQACRLEIDRNSKEVITELEYRNLDLGHFKGEGIGKFSKLPDPVIQTLKSFMTEEQFAAFNPRIITTGKANHVAGYSMEGRNSGISWEFEILEDGQLVELEIESKSKDITASSPQ